MAIGIPEAPSHNLTVLSCDPEASRDPSGENDKDVTPREWPEAPSHNLTVSSYDPEASRGPSGENDRTFTEREYACRTATKDSNVVEPLASQLSR